MARASAAAVLFALVCCFLVGPAPARRPTELPPQVVLDAVDREASAEPLLPKPLAVVEAADPSTVLSVQAKAHEVDPQIFRCGGEDMAVSEDPLSLDTRAQPAAAKGEVEEDVQEQEQELRDNDSDSDTDSDSDSDDEDNGYGIVGWFWRLARRSLLKF